MAPSRTETLRDLFRPLPWAVPASLLVTAPTLAASGSAPLTSAALVAGWVAVVAAFARRFGLSPAAAVVAAIVALAHPALHLALASGTLWEAVVPAGAVALAAVVRLGPKDSEALPGFGRREIAAMALCAVAAAIDVAAAFSPLVLWIFDLAYDPGSFRVVATRWKRIGWGYAAVTLPAWWAVSGAAPMFGPGGFKGAACVSLLIPPRDGTIAVVSVLLPIAAVAASAFIRQRHDRPRPFGIATAAALATILLAVLPGAIMDATTPPVFASLGTAWCLAAGLSHVRDRIVTSESLRPTPMPPLPAVPGLRDVVAAAPAAAPSCPPVKVPVVVAATGAATAVETAVSAAVAGVLTELRAVAPKPDDELLLWERLSGATIGPRAAPLPTPAPGDPVADFPRDARPMAVVGLPYPELVVALASTGRRVILVARGRATARHCALDFPDVADVSVVRHDAAGSLPFADGSLAGLVGVLDVDGRTPAALLASLVAARRAVAPDGGLHVMFTDGTHPTNLAALRDGRGLVQSEELIRACAAEAGWRCLAAEDVAPGRRRLRFGGFE